MQGVVGSGWKWIEAIAVRIIDPSCLVHRPIMTSTSAHHDQYIGPSCIVHRPIMSSTFPRTCQSHLVEGQVLFKRVQSGHLLSPEGEGGLLSDLALGELMQQDLLLFPDGGQRSPSLLELLGDRQYGLESGSKSSVATDAASSESPSAHARW